MQKLTETIFKMNPPGGFFNTTVIKNTFPDLSASAIKSLVHRALKKGEILRVKPGMYFLGKDLRQTDFHPFVIAGMLSSPSSVSLESALSYHGLIPEGVFQISSITPTRSKVFFTPMGDFLYHKIPANMAKAGVKIVEFNEKTWAFIAEPLRAIADLIYLRKEVSWEKDGMRFLTDSMRIEADELSRISFDQFETIFFSIRDKRTQKYLAGFKSEIKA